ncbi:MAG TPA: SGNH/GDSL hydrolase family protein [Rhodanobacteraceae bacterium]|nr:SGNH/GDSL hydrolase family protein [Rhodanobacteraceae bacterium]
MADSMIGPFASAIAGPITRPITQAGAGGQSLDSAIRALFASAPGDYWDNLAANTFFQDSAGTTANTATGQPCGRFVGQRGNHWLQATSGARPTYMEEGGLKFVRFNGVDQVMQAAALALTGATKATLVVGIRQQSVGGAPGVVIENAMAFAGSGGFGVFVDNAGPSGSLGGGLGDGANYVFSNGPGSAAGITRVASFVFDPAGANADERVQIRIDGAAVDETQVAEAGTPGASGIPIAGFYLGGRAGGINHAPIDVFCGIIVGDALTGVALENAERWCSIRTGTAVPFEVAPAQFSETGATVDQGTHFQTSPFSVATFDTSATVIDVHGYTTIYNDFAAYAKLEVLVDGVLTHTVSASANGAFSSGRIPLAAGPKTVSIVSGGQSRPSGTVIGTWFTSIRADAALTQSLPAPTNRILFYGDSITVGANATTPATQGYTQLVRAAYAPDSVAVEGYGYRTLEDDAIDATARAAFVAKVVAYAPKIVWMAIGTNDYGLSAWSAADFGAAYAATLDALHAALPSAIIYCQTPIVRTTETANGFGNTLGDYRTQISNAVSTRTSYATLVDGTAILTTGDLADGVHPTTAGHAIYAAAVIAELGI